MFYRGAEVSDCGKYVLVTTHQECRDNLLYFTKLNSSDDITGLFDLTQVVYKFEHDFEYITNTGSKFLFRTNRNAPNYRLVIIDFDYTPNSDNIEKQVGLHIFTKEKMYSKPPQTFLPQILTVIILNVSL